MGLLARTCLPFALALGFTVPATADAERPSICKSKKKKAAKKKKAKKPAKPKFTALTVSKLAKKKMPDDQIVEKATVAGYKVTKTEKKKLLKYKVKKPLIARLETLGKSSATPVADAAPVTKAPPSFDLEKTIDPNEIDFDSVAPPKGMPEDVAKKQRDEAEAEKKPASPSKQPLKVDDKKEKRVVIAAGK